MPKVRKGLAPVQQPEEEKARVLKPQESYTKKPKVTEDRMKKERVYEHNERPSRAKPHEPKEPYQRPSRATKTKEELHEIRSKVAKERWDKVRQQQAEEKWEELNARCKDLLRFISNLKWQNNSIGQGHIINWDSNEHYQEIESLLNECLNIVDDMNNEQLERYLKYLQDKADKQVYKYPEEMLMSAYQYDERGLSNGAVGWAIGNLTECRVEGYYILALEDIEPDEPYEVEVNVTDEESPFEPTDKPMGVD